MNKMTEEEVLELIKEYSGDGETVIHINTPLGEKVKEGIPLIKIKFKGE